jgi:hypothetical protein
MTWVATAVVGGSLLSGYMGAEAAESAAGTQASTTMMGIAEQQRQEVALRELLAPYTEAGPQALQQQQALLGLGGPEAQRQAVGGIAGSPLFQAQVRQGEEALLQQASATGGLRGGNVQAALAQFRPSMLNQAIQQQYGNLAGITSLGQQSATGVGTSGMQTGTNIANLLQQQGAAQAGGILGQSAAQQQMVGAIPQGLGMYYGLTGQTPF